MPSITNKGKVKKKVKFNIVDPIFHNCFGVFIGYSWEQVLADVKECNPPLLKHIEKEEGMNTTLGMYIDFEDSDETYRLIFIRDSNSLTTIAHELVHAVERSLRSRGFSLTRETEETYAYYYEFLFGEILNHIK